MAEDGLDLACGSGAKEEVHFGEGEFTVVVPGYCSPAEGTTDREAARMQQDPESADDRTDRTGAEEYRGVVYEAQKPGLWEPLASGKEDSTEPARLAERGADAGEDLYAVHP